MLENFRPRRKANVAKVSCQTHNSRVHSHATTVRKLLKQKPRTGHSSVGKKKTLKNVMKEAIDLFSGCCHYAVN